MERKRRLGDRTHTVTFRCTEKEYEELKLTAERNGQSHTDVIRDGIRMKYNLSNAGINLDY